MHLCVCLSAGALSHWQLPSVSVAALCLLATAAKPRRVLTPTKPKPEKERWLILVRQSGLTPVALTACYRLTCDYITVCICHIDSSPIIYWSSGGAGGVYTSLTLRKQTSLQWLGGWKSRSRALKGATSETLLVNVRSSPINFWCCLLMQPERNGVRERTVNNIFFRNTK